MARPICPVPSASMYLLIDMAVNEEDSPVYLWKKLHELFQSIYMS